MNFPLFNKKASSKSKAKTTKRGQSKKFNLSRKQQTITVVIGVLAIGGIGYGIYSASTMDSVGAGSCVSQTFKKGSSATCVKYLQQLTNQAYKNKSTFLGAFTALAANGKYDAKTESAIRGIQAHSYDNANVALAVTGQVDVKTWAMLCSFSYDFSLRKSAGCVDSKGKNSSTIAKHIPVGIR